MTVLEVGAVRGLGAVLEEDIADRPIDYVVYAFSLKRSA